jgi:FkbM family methyltransferase
MGGKISPSSLLGRVLLRVGGSLRGRATPPLFRLIDVFGAAYPDASFIQVGSNDGVQLDPLREQVVERRWSGVMVEPIPSVFARLQTNYGNQPRVRLENVAIADENGTRSLYFIPEADDHTSLPEWYQALASFRKDVILQHRSEIPDIESRIATIEVSCSTFDALCARNGIDQVDLIHTDTEGYDYEIIKSIDLAALRPKVVLFEHYHLDRTVYEECVGHLRSLGYEDLAVGMDTVCLHPGLVAGRPRLLRTWEALRRRGPVLAFRTEVEGDQLGA